MMPSTAGAAAVAAVPFMQTHTDDIRFAVACSTVLASLPDADCGPLAEVDALLTTFRMLATNEAAASNAVFAAKKTLVCALRKSKLLQRVQQELPNAEFTGMQRVTDYLFIGPYQPLLKRGQALVENGITAVLSATKEPPNQLPRCVKRKLCLRVSDHIAEQNLDLGKVVEFVRAERDGVPVSRGGVLASGMSAAQEDEDASGKEQKNSTTKTKIAGLLMRGTSSSSGGAARPRPPGRVFIHCGAGISRAATCTLACLCELEGMHLKDAMAYLKSVRPCINPNATFRKLLTERYGAAGADVGEADEGALPGGISELEDARPGEEQHEEDAAGRQLREMLGGDEDEAAARTMMESCAGKNTANPDSVGAALAAMNFANGSTRRGGGLVPGACLSVASKQNLDPVSPQPHHKGAKNKVRLFPGTKR